MKPECSIVRDLLPLYAENMTSEQTERFITQHLNGCPECNEEFKSIKDNEALLIAENIAVPKADNTNPFKKIMKKMNRQFYSVAYAALIFLIFLGYCWTGDSGENLMYNSLIMPIVGIFGYYVFRLKAIYKLPILLLIIDTFICIFKLVELDIYTAFLWTLIYSIFVFIGIAIAFLLHFALRKEKE